MLGTDDPVGYFTIFVRKESRQEGDLKLGAEFRDRVYVDPRKDVGSGDGVVIGGLGGHWADEPAIAVPGCVGLEDDKTRGGAEGVELGLRGQFLDGHGCNGGADDFAWSWSE